MAKIDVHGLTEAELEALKQLAIQHTGKANVSGFVKQLIRAQLGKPTTIKVNQVDLPTSPRQERMRLELKLPPHIADYLIRGAEIGKMTTNRYAISILMGYVEQHPVLTDNEVKALFQFNAQLLRIGQNLNQLTRKFNAGETVSLTSQQIAQLQEFIEQHASKVGDVIRQHRTRVQR